MDLYEPVKIQRHFEMDYIKGPAINSSSRVLNILADISKDSGKGVTLCVKNSTRLPALDTDLYQTVHLPCDEVARVIEEKHLQLIALSVILAASLISNLMAFMVFFRRPSLLSVSNRFVLNLVVCNFIMTIFIMPVMLITISAEHWIMGDIFCDICGSLVTVLFCACIFTLTSISVDRYYAIVRPLHYPIRLTKRRSFVYTCFVWIISITIGIAPLFGVGNIAYSDSTKICMVQWESTTILSRVYVYFLIAFCFVAPFIVMLWVYIVVCRVAHNTSERARRHSVIRETDTAEHDVILLSANKIRKGDTFIFRQHSVGEKQRRRSSSIKSIFAFYKEDWKAAKTGLICMLTFAFCWFPFFLIIMLKASQNTLAIPSWLESMVLYAALTGCIMNPIVYVFRSRLVIRECKSIVSRRQSAFLGTILPRMYSTKDICSSGHCSPLAQMTPHKTRAAMYRCPSEEPTTLTADSVDHLDLHVVSQNALQEVQDENTMAFL